MKYGKEFQQILESSHFPDEWKSSAIEYGQLKKLIKNVVTELSGMGLSPDVLQKLLVAEEDSSNNATPSVVSPGASSPGDEGDVLEFEFESPDATPDILKPRSSSHSSHTAHQVIVAPILDDDGSEADLGSSAFSSSHAHHHRKFRLRLLSDSESVSAPSPNDDGRIRPLGVGEMMRTRSISGDSVERMEGKRHQRRVVRSTPGGSGGIKAEYVIAGDSEHPVPQIRLVISPSPPSSDVYSPSPISASDTDHTDTTDDEDDDPPSLARDRPFNPTASPTTPRAFLKLSPHLVPAIDIIPPSPTLERIRTAQSPIWAIASKGGVGDGMRELSLGDAAIADDATVDPDTVPASELDEIKTAEQMEHNREFIIPLSSDLAFFNLLTSALTSLSTFHQSQQAVFQQSVTNLCRQISQSIQPENKSFTKDLYAWRTIFTLWIEAQIFESSSERDRGERTIEAAEGRLQVFANEVVKRGLGDRRTIKGKKSREAWEEFLRLNVLLLDLKRFQLANINAARKILKKHDKRTALTASSGFPSFVRSTLSSHVDNKGNVSTWSFYNTSLPHVLLASLTDTLLPILPSLDDYACQICTSIAFKPIRLGCGHLFCVRCLVKMQKAGKDECPLCRSKTVLVADRGSLDYAVMNFMKAWFPKEVKEKQKENELEVAKENAKEMGMDTRCSIM
ncbi:E3 ubiquitin-protein ligase BAH, partial [Tremellales sp. Uapishka_1]